LKDKNELKLDIVSKIDDDIIERASDQRNRLINNPRMSYRKKIGAIAMLAATFILLIGGLLIALLPNNQVPVYEGMTVSGSNPMLGGGSEGVPSQNAQIAPLNKESNGNNGNHYGWYKGDHVKGEEDIDQDNPYGDGKDTIGDVIKPSDLSPEATQDMYYANPNEDVFVTVHINNPSGYEILSFTLNGQKYSNYMFEYGSDLENLILKVNVGDAEGIKEYTIDQIKYVDGTEIKDVKMEGDRTVKIGIRTDKQPTVTVSEYLATLNRISFKATINDELELIKKSSGKIQAVLYDGDTIVATKDITESGQTVLFDGLDQNTLYQYAILITYDDLSGEGIKSSVQGVNAVYTHNPLLFDEIEIGKTGISFKYNWYSELEEKTLVSVSLLKDGVKVRDIDVNALTVDGLLSNNEYTLVAEYKMGDGTEKIQIDFTTEAKAIPDVVISEPVRTQTSIGFTLTEADTDNIGAITKIELLHGNDAPIVAANLDVREFTNLLSNNTYTVKVTYVYDLNDGVGEKEGTSSFDITTEAKAIPDIVISESIRTQTSIGFTLTETDTDNIGAITKIELLHGNDAPIVAANLDVKEFTNLLSNNTYTVKVTYVYDLNDGVGEQTGYSALNITTEAKPTPVVSFSNIKSEVGTYTFDIDVVDFDETFEILGVELYKGAEKIAESNLTKGVVFAITEKMTEYTVRITYQYDLNDGRGLQTVESTRSTWAMSEGLEIGANGYIVGIGACTDSILYIDRPVGAGAFAGNLDIKEVYFTDGATFIGAGAFEECINIESVHFGEGTKEMGHFIFKGCTQLETVYFSSAVKMIPYETFMNCAKLRNVVFDENSQITTIGSYSFYRCTSLKNISIPDSVAKIEEYAFAESGLEGISIGENGKLNFIGKGAFNMCRSLVEFKIPKSVITIEEELFSFCSSLEKVSIHRNVKTIKRNAFSACPSLNFIVIPESVIVIGENVFFNVYDLTIYTDATERPSGWSANMNPNNCPIVFEAKKSTYSFVTNGGSSVESITDYVIEMPKSLRSGYVLVGWYDNEELSGNPVSFPYYSEEKTTLYAKWINEYTFVTNGGTPVANGNEAVIQTSPETTRDGYYLIGWYDNAELSGSPVEFPYYNEENTTLYAKWFDLEGNHISEGFEMQNGWIYGMGDCTDKVLYINQPIMYGAFKDNLDIEKVYLLNGAEFKGSIAFQGCENLKYVYVGEGVKTIYSITFDKCTGLESVFISSTVEIIEEAAFQSCSSLNSVVFENNSSLTTIGDFAFNLCTSLQSISIPDSVTKIGENAFQSCEELSEVEFGENSQLSIIKQRAFAHCTSLVSFEIPKNVTVIDAEAFVSCSSLKRIDIHNGITTIKREAFRYCSALNLIVLPDSVVTLGDSVFVGCFNLTVYTEFSEKPSGWQANMNPENRPVVFNAKKNTYSFVTNGGSPVQSITDYVLSMAPKTVRDGMVFVGWYDNEALTGDAVAFPYTNETKTTLYAKWINEYVFVTNGGTPVANGREVVIQDYPETTKDGYILIGWYDNEALTGDAVAFPYTNETKTTLYAKWINEYVFVTNGGTPVANGNEAVIQTSPKPKRDGYALIGWYDNAELSGSPVEFPYYSEEKNTLYAKWFDLEGNQISEGFEIQDGVIVGMGSCKDKVLYIDRPVGFKAFEGNYDIEAVYFIGGAVYTGHSAFIGCDNIKYVYFGEGVKTVSATCFDNCTGIESVYISQTVEIIENGAFQGCSGLTNVVFDENSSLSVIQDHSFNQCRSLKSFSVPDSVTRIGEGAFQDCTDLKNITFGRNSGVSVIKARAFWYCTSLESFEFPENVTTVEEYLFYQCNSLINIKINNNITAIKHYAFGGCWTLSSISIPSTVTTISGFAFEACHRLTIYAEATEAPSEWDGNMNPENRPIVWGVKENSYSFVSNGGSAVDGIQCHAIGYTPVTVKDDCIFLGWYDNEELAGHPVKFPYYSEEKTTLYAGWFDTTDFKESENLYVYDGEIMGIGTCDDNVLCLNRRVNSDAFRDCDIVSTVVFGTEVSLIEQFAFANCDNLVNVIFVPGATPEIGYSSFMNAYNKSEFKVYVPEESYEYFMNCTENNWQTYIAGLGKIVTY